MPSKEATIEAQTTRPKLGGRVDSLTSLRWFAALGVFCFHVAPTLAPIPVVRPLMRAGYEGVPFFFVLSGFVLTWSARPGDRARNFYVRRFARVWPLLAASLVPALAIEHYWNHAHFSPGGVIATLTLTQSWTTNHFYTANIVTWTLSCEAFFYLMYPLLHRVLSRLRTPGLFAVAAVMPVLTVISHTWPGSEHFSAAAVRLTYASPLALIPMFVVGMCTALAVQRGWRPPLGVAGTVFVLTVVVALRWRSAFQPGLIPGLPPSAAYFDAVVVPIFALLIAAAALKDVQQRNAPQARRVLSSPVLIKLGEWSFAFYLVHYTVLTAFRHFGMMSRLHSGSDKLVVMLLLLAAATSAAAVANLAIEVPAERYLRKKLGGTPPRVQAHAEPVAPIPEPARIG